MKYNKLFNQEPWGKCYNVIAVDGLSIIRIYAYDGEEDSVYFNGLLVAKQERKKGRGDEILKEAEEFTKKKFPKVKKFIVYAEKKWIKEWYERLGYEHVGFDKKEQMDKLIKKL